MRIFLTGATGFVGRPLIHELHTHNHTILALSRSSTSAAKLSSLGVSVQHGSLEDLSALKAGAAQCDAVIHLAFTHDDWSDMERASRIDRAAIGALAEGLSVGGKGKPLVIASGTLGVKNGRVADEDDAPEGGNVLAVRYQSADLLHRLTQELGVRGMVVRVSAVVHGKEDWGFVPLMVRTARENGVVTVVEEWVGHRWPAVHKEDVAALFRLVVEKGRAGGTYNAVTEEGVYTKEVLEVVARKSGLEVETLSSADAKDKLGFLAILLALDQPTSSLKTQNELGWKPSRIGLLEDVEMNYGL